MNNKLYEDETWPAGTAMLYGNSNVIKNLLTSFFDDVIKF